MRAEGYVLCIALLAPGLATAQAMNDPTRPPGGFAAGDPDVAGDAGGGLVLQSVMISPTRKSAIINGEMVRLGGKYGDAVLVKVTENEAVLRSGSETQVLKLYPGVEKRELAPAAKKAAPRRAKAAQGGAGTAATGGAPQR
ncbi:MAG: hypothetical protein HYV99_07025 [Betaproteobacteria bacterium]|nr:hypothetical protein [Betaproteobacteria bacterium]MBI2509705.1 hypothetical protein [Betaproteobacteria bacterium]